MPTVRKADHGGKGITVEFSKIEETHNSILEDIVFMADGSHLNQGFPVPGDLHPDNHQWPNWADRMWIPETREAVLLLAPVERDVCVTHGEFFAWFFRNGVRMEDVRKNL